MVLLREKVGGWVNERQAEGERQQRGGQRGESGKRVEVDSQE